MKHASDPIDPPPRPSRSRGRTFSVPCGQCGAPLRYHEGMKLASTILGCGNCGSRMLIRSAIILRRWKLACLVAVLSAVVAVTIAIVLQGHRN